jgi:hypothetical protein
MCADPLSSRKQLTWTALTLLRKTAFGSDTERVISERYGHLIPYLPCGVRFAPACRSGRTFAGFDPGLPCTTSAIPSRRCARVVADLDAPNARSVTSEDAAQRARFELADRAGSPATDNGHCTHLRCGKPTSRTAITAPRYVATAHFADDVIAPPAGRLPVTGLATGE